MALGPLAAGQRCAAYPLGPEPNAGGASARRAGAHRIGPLALPRDIAIKCAEQPACAHEHRSPVTYLAPATGPQSVERFARFVTQWRAGCALPIVGCCVLHLLYPFFVSRITRCKRIS